MQWNADTYSQKHAFVFHYGAGLLDLLAPKPGELILDLGCGSGELTQRIVAADAVVIGLDASASMIAKAREQFPTLDFRVGDGASFALPERFDAIFSNAALHWMPAAAAVVQQMQQHLKPGGRLVAEFGGKGNVAQITNALLRHLHQRGHTHIQAEWWYFPSPGQYATLLEQHGFRVQLVQHYDRPTPLADPETGLTDWIQQFGANFFAGVGAEEQADILAAVNDELRPVLFQDGQWVADYKRLRVVAQK
ncbi:methyltransferase domain-containing protein [Hymenobacter aerilatus]|uniref:Methyltransferase domain-containing protein n=1 Tax=Hymenobacter aerilatus TaxID=2932251 RepID=A0A8T9SWH0_9BACT|nr:methyltransferase domain-containing protein [Hymenobacter aerilatus]UOR06087.1 methyltransferase domain-containing protein [Hymenobacter aerilatus]